MSFRKRFLSLLHTKNSLTAIAVTAAMTAISVVLCRYLGFSPENSPLRFELGFLPISIVAYLFGPVYAGAGYLISDIIGSFLSGYAPFPLISLCKLLLGIGMGIAFYRKPPSLSRTILAFLVLNLAIDVGLMSPSLSLLYTMTGQLPPDLILFDWHPAVCVFIWRLIDVSITFPLRVATFYFLLRALEKPFSRLIRRWDAKETAFVRYANSFQAVTVPGLERIRSLLTLLGSPEKDLRCLHIAGTNGKGSVSACLAEILAASGYRVGKYTSPNLIDVNERIAVDGAPISDKDLSSILAEIEPLVSKVEKEGHGAPTQFEIWTAAAFLHFYREKCDYVVLEVGLGGEFDATNVIDHNEIAVITRLGIDHAQYLGTTLAEIAHAKSGIMKAVSTAKTVVTAPQEPEAMTVLEERAAALGLTVTVANATPLAPNGIHETFTVDGIDDVVTCGIPGLHQIENAAVAATAALALGMEKDKILLGIARARNPARFEILSESPLLVFDGGHNENGVAACAASFSRYFGTVHRTVIFAAMSDKEIDGSLSILNDGSTEFIFTTVKDNPRAATAEELLAKAAPLALSAVAENEIANALRLAKEKGRPTLIVGSLYLYKDVMHAIKEHPALFPAPTGK